MTSYLYQYLQRLPRGHTSCHSTYRAAYCDCKTIRRTTAVLTRIWQNDPQMLASGCGYEQLFLTFSALRMATRTPTLLVAVSLAGRSLARVIPDHSEPNQASERALSTYNGFFSVGGAIIDPKNDALQSRNLEGEGGGYSEITRQQQLSIQVVACVLACTSLICTIVASWWFFSMRKAFRHRYLCEWLQSHVHQTLITLLDWSLFY